METKEIKNEIAQKNAMDLTTTDAKAVANRLKAIDTLGVAIKESLVKGINEDYEIIPGTTKPCLLLPGARKICMLYGLTASVPELKEDKEKGIIIANIKLYSGDKFIAESYGASTIGKQRDYGWEYNKAIKIAQKRAFVGATLQVANLSKVFTQDTEDMEPKKDYTQEQKNKVFTIAKEIYKLFNKTPRSKEQFKDAWNWLCNLYNKFLEETGTKLDKNIYELGLSMDNINKFREWAKAEFNKTDINTMVDMGEQVEFPAKKGK